MKVSMVGIGVLACVLSTAAYAETWTVALVFEKGTQGCQNASPFDHTFTLEGTKLTMSSRGATLTSVTVPENGMVSQDFRAANGNRLRLVGNVKTKDLALQNTEFGCSWKAVPKQ